MTDPIESEGKHLSQKAQYFIKLTSEVASHKFCHILFVRSESIGPAHAQGEGIKYESEN